ncbi:hypothetical protein [Streptomyces sp. NBC_01408]|uniref:hypothetical protein n=1 Tax=Streptomyces sp. NBC_01408 TaxID=2903855 RepID=UPI00225C0DA3|nr:hypothetical protein [Streptomyces sp. NBC_01408]MCX4691287.1 hypothetical protein [Streptomyces sp. NBC_01408]
MGLSPEWEKLFEASPRMNLASANPPGGGGGGGGNKDLDVSQSPWTSASGVSAELTVTTSTALTRLDSAHEGVVPTLEGFMLPAVLGEVRTSWKGRLEDVRAECTRLEGSLKTAGKEFGEVDHRVKGGFDALHPDGADGQHRADKGR